MDEFYRFKDFTNNEITQEKVKNGQKWGQLTPYQLKRRSQVLAEQVLRAIEEKGKYHNEIAFATKQGPELTQKIQQIHDKTIMMMKNVTDIHGENCNKIDALANKSTNT